MTDVTIAKSSLSRLILLLLFIPIWTKLSNFSIAYLVKNTENGNIQLILIKQRNKLYNRDAPVGGSFFKPYWQSFGNS